MADGLTAALITQIAADAGAIAGIVNYLHEVETFASGIHSYKRAMIKGRLTEPATPIPLPPASLVVPPGAAPAIEARTRTYARILRAQPGFNKSKARQYGIAAPEAVEAGVPKVLAAKALSGYQVELRLGKAGHTVLRVESKRAGDTDWVQIGIAQMARFLDDRGPLVDGEPELREYRVRGMQANQPVGAPSDVLTAVSAP